MELSKEQKDAFTPGLHVARLKHIRASYEAAKKGHAFIVIPSHDEQIAIIDALLAAEEQQPVGFISGSRKPALYGEHKNLPPGTKLYLHPQQGKAVQVPDDVRRMDWLVSKTVNVRDPQVYGSHSMFWSQTISDDWSEVHATTLREQIDAAIKAESAPQPEAK